MFSRRYIKKLDNVIFEADGNEEWLDRYDDTKQFFKDGHEIFLEYAKEIVGDTEWKDIFINMSKGNFIHNMQFQNDTLKYRKGGGNSITIDVTEGVDKIIEFIRSNTDINSSQDRLINKDSFKEIHSKKEIQHISWDKVKTHEARSALIHQFTHLMVDKYKLNERKELVSLIYMGLNNGKIQSDNIKMFDGYIDDIDNLVYQNKKWTIIDTNNTKENKKNINKKRSTRKKGTTTSIPKKHYFDVAWSSYINEIYKKRYSPVKKSNKSKRTTGRSYTVSSPRLLSCDT